MLHRASLYYPLKSHCPTPPQTPYTCLSMSTETSSQTMCCSTPMDTFAWLTLALACDSKKTAQYRAMWLSAPRTTFLRRSWEWVVLVCVVVIALLLLAVVVVMVVVENFFSFLFFSFSTLFSCIRDRSQEEKSKTKRTLPKQTTKLVSPNSSPFSSAYMSHPFGLWWHRLSLIVMHSTACLPTPAHST